MCGPSRNCQCTIEAMSITTTACFGSYHVDFHKKTQTCHWYWCPTQGQRFSSLLNICQKKHHPTLMRMNLSMCEIPTHPYGVCIISLLLSRKGCYGCKVPSKEYTLRFLHMLYDMKTHYILWIKAIQLWVFEHS